MAGVFDTWRRRMILDKVAEGGQRFEGLFLVEFGPAQLAEIGLANLELRFSNPLAGGVYIDDPLVFESGVDPVLAAEMGFGEHKLRLGDPLRARKVANEALELLGGFNAAFLFHRLLAFDEIMFGPFELFRGSAGTGGKPCGEGEDCDIFHD